MNEQFGQGLAEILSVSPNAVTLNLELGDNWDSMAMISAVALIDETFGVTVSAQKLAKCQNVGDLAALVNSAIQGVPAS